MGYTQSGNGHEHQWGAPFSVDMCKRNNRMSVESMGYEIMVKTQLIYILTIEERTPNNCRLTSDI